MRTGRLVHSQGALAQLVARFHGMEEVRGSSPLSSTNYFQWTGRIASVSFQRSVLVLNGFGGGRPIGRRHPRAAARPDGLWFARYGMARSHVSRLPNRLYQGVKPQLRRGAAARGTRAVLAAQADSSRELCLADPVHPGDRHQPCFSDEARGRPEPRAANGSHRANGQPRRGPSPHSRDAATQRRLGHIDAARQ